MFVRVPEGGLDAFVEESPGANIQGSTLEEARENLREAVILVIECNRELAEQASGFLTRLPAPCQELNRGAPLDASSDQSHGGGIRCRLPRDRPAPAFRAGRVSRYSGSDPTTMVWNLGWPLALAIYDPRSGLHMGPSVYLVPPAQLLILAVVRVFVAAARWAVGSGKVLVAWPAPSQAWCLISHRSGPARDGPPESRR